MTATTAVAPQRHRWAINTSRGAVVLIAALGASACLLWLGGFPISPSLSALWAGSFGSPRALANTLNQALPLTLMALGWVVALSVGKANIGLDGQAILGAIFGAAAAIHLSAATPVMFVVVAIAGAVGGALWALVAMYLWARHGVNEMISTLLLNLIAAQLLAWLIRGPMADPATTYAQSRPIREAASWPEIPGTLVSTAIVLIPVAAVGIHILIRSTGIGLTMRIVGRNRDAAEAAGIAPTWTTVAAFALSGGLAGLGGATLITLGTTRVLTENVTGGRGFEAIAVALIVGNIALAIPFGAMLFAALQQGGGLMEARVGVPSAIVVTVQGVVILAVAAAMLLRYGRPRSRQPDVSRDEQR